jgi:hypothetical protein
MAKGQKRSSREPKKPKKEKPKPTDRKTGQQFAYCEIVFAKEK